MIIMDQHECFMTDAIELSRHHMRAGAGGPFGAVIVKDNRIIARGWNQVTSTNDPTAHAEMVAIRAACQHLQSFSLEGCQIYTSCEPCPMCLAAIYWARLQEIYYANSREDATVIGFDDAIFYEEIAKPLDQRTLPVRRLLARDAFAVFEEWWAKPDRISY